jgi:hypothetical protein
MIMQAVNIEANQINIDMKSYYNGYIFNRKAKTQVYNSSMILYFFNQILKNEDLKLIDPNLSIDPQRLRRLVRSEHNRDVLIQIIKEGGIVSGILEKFSIDNLDDNKHFISLLFYMGLLTIKGSSGSLTQLVIPNYSIQQVYWEQVRSLIEESSELAKINTDVLEKHINNIASAGEIEGFIDYISQNVFSKLSDYDLQQFDEKYIKILLLSYLLLNTLYIPMSEYETASGRTDIFLQRNPKYSADVKYEWVWELKYCKTKSTPKEIAQATQDGLEQLNQYIASHRLKNRPNLKSALLIFIGKNKYKIVIPQ